MCAGVKTSPEVLVFREPFQTAEGAETETATADDRRCLAAPTTERRSTATHLTQAPAAGVTWVYRRGRRLRCELGELSGGFFWVFLFFFPRGRFFQSQTAGLLAARKVGRNFRSVPFSCVAHVGAGPLLALWIWLPFAEQTLWRRVEDFFFVCVSRVTIQCLKSRQNCGNIFHKGERAILSKEKGEFPD